MAARASSTERALSVTLPMVKSARSWVVSAAGIAWGHASLIVATTMPRALEGLPRIDLASTGLTAVFEWTALLPLAITMAVLTGTTEPLSAVSASGLPAYALPVPALTGYLFAAGSARLARAPWSRHAAIPLLAALLTVSVISATGTARTVMREHIAASLFLEATSTSADPWLVASSRAAARTLTRRYPETTWASEAWRIIAIDAETRGSRYEQLAAWEGFRSCFEPHESAGQAIAHLNLASLTRSASRDVAIGHYLAAHRAVARSGPDVQRWIAAHAATELERLTTKEGLYATALYWTLARR